MSWINNLKFKFYSESGRLTKTLSKARFVSVLYKNRALIQPRRIPKKYKTDDQKIEFIEILVSYIYLSLKEKRDEQLRKKKEKQRAIKLLNWRKLRSLLLSKRSKYTKYVEDVFSERAGGVFYFVTSDTITSDDLKKKRVPKKVLEFFKTNGFTYERNIQSFTKIITKDQLQHFKKLKVTKLFFEKFKTVYRKDRTTAKGNRPYTRFYMPIETDSEYYEKELVFGQIIPRRSTFLIGKKSNMFYTTIKVKKPLVVDRTNMKKQSMYLNLLIYPHFEKIKAMIDIIRASSPSIRRTMDVTVRTEMEVEDENGNSEWFSSGRIGLSDAKLKSEVYNLMAGNLISRQFISDKNAFLERPGLYTYMNNADVATYSVKTINLVLVWKSNKNEKNLTEVMQDVFSKALRGQEKAQE